MSERHFDSRQNRDALDRWIERTLEDPGRTRAERPQHELEEWEESFDRLHPKGEFEWPFLRIALAAAATVVCIAVGWQLLKAISG